MGLRPIDGFVSDRAGSGDRGVEALHHEKYTEARGSQSDGLQQRSRDKLFDSGEAEIDPAKRVQIYNEVQEIMADDMPALWLWDRSAVLAYRKRVKGDLFGGAHMENFGNVWVTDGK